MSGEPARRLFFALWPDEAQRAALAHSTRKVLRSCGGRPVPPENLHVTLAFLGSVPAARLGELRAIAGRTAAALAQEAAPFVLRFEHLVHFPRAQVLAVLASSPPESAPAGDLRSLAATLTSETAAAGFSPDLKPFRAHVTVARKVARVPRESAIRPLEWRFCDFALVESSTRATGAVYSIVESYALSDAEKLRT
ncbi:MAG TPA: RNA 2',3'-cyclic phosphodiesterase [Steroidobacteraceae bacterium]|nr:RNA 2',3'-cyclic phosphodiesterase [Steroidobacteraceae bacterium]